MGLQINKNFDDKLKEIEFYKNSETHQFMLPYVGSNYEEYRVLLVAESHYLGNEEDRKKVVDFQKWYEGKESISLSEPGHIKTREVVNTWFIDGNGLFKRIEKDFFIVPSTNGSRGIYSTKEVEEKSLNNFEQVIKILKPNYILFLSKKSYYIFAARKSDYFNITDTFDHPASIWWYRKRKDGRKSKDKFREKIEMIFKN